MGCVGGLGEGEFVLIYRQSIFWGVGDSVVSWGKMPFSGAKVGTGGRAEAEFFGVLGVWIRAWRTFDFVGFEGLNEFGGWQRCF